MDTSKHSEPVESCSGRREISQFAAVAELVSANSGGRMRSLAKSRLPVPETSGETGVGENGFLCTSYHDLL